VRGDERAERDGSAVLQAGLPHPCVRLLDRRSPDAGGAHGSEPGTAAETDTASGSCVVLATPEGLRRPGTLLGADLAVVVGSPAGTSPPLADDSVPLVWIAGPDATLGDAVRNPLGVVLDAVADPGLVEALRSRGASVWVPAVELDLPADRTSPAAERSTRTGAGTGAVRASSLARDLLAGLGEEPAPDAVVVTGRLAFLQDEIDRGLRELSAAVESVAAGRWPTPRARARVSGLVEAVSSSLGRAVGTVEELTRLVDATDGLSGDDAARLRTAGIDLRPRPPVGDEAAVLARCVAPLVAGADSPGAAAGELTELAGLLAPGGPAAVQERIITAFALGPLDALVRAGDPPLAAGRAPHLTVLALAAVVVGLLVHPWLVPVAAVALATLPLVAIRRNDAPDRRSTSLAVVATVVAGLAGGALGAGWTGVDPAMPVWVAALVGAPALATSAVVVLQHRDVRRWVGATRLDAVDRSVVAWDRQCRGILTEEYVLGRRRVALATAARSFAEALVSAGTASAWPRSACRRAATALAEGAPPPVVADAVRTARGVVTPLCGEAERGRLGPPLEWTTSSRQRLVPSGLATAASVTVRFHPLRRPAPSDPEAGR
jgi:hypothetical protein